MQHTKQQRLGLFGLIFFGVCLALWGLAQMLLGEAQPLAPLALRWAALAGLLVYATVQRSLTTWIFFGMLFGASFGFDAPQWAIQLKIVSDVFLKLIKSIIGPLLFGTLVVGIAGHSDIKKVGRMGIISIIYFEIVTTIALFIGLLAINITQAGVGVTLAPGMQADIPKVEPQTWQQIVLHVFPENIAKSIAEGQVLQIVVFSVLFAVALAMLPEAQKRPVLKFAESLSQVMFKFTGIVMLLAPFAVSAALAYTIAKMGLSVVPNLLKLLGTLYGALALFLGAVLLPIALLFRIPVVRFVRAIAEPVSLAFATTSSEAALPLAMERMVEFGVPRRVVAFVMPTGYSFNLDGTTLYLSLAAVFVAQAAHIPLTVGQQLTMVFTLMLSSKGVAGIPRASLVILLGTAASFGLPTFPIFIILGIDALMDMARTAVNVVGNCLATAVVARLEGEAEYIAQPYLSTLNADA